MSVDRTTMRTTMGTFATGVAVVTTMDGDTAHGMTVNSLTSISLDPPLILVSLTDDARTTDAVRATGRFAVSVLSTRQEGIARRFAKSGEDHFAGLPLEYGRHELPVVPDALAHVECATHSEQSAGDHLVVIGSVVRTCVRSGEPLAFFAGSFGEFSAGRDGRFDWFF